MTKALGAYIFAGGFTVGVRKHFDVACHLEASNYGVSTVKLNMPELPVHYGVDKWPLKELRKHEWDFIYGNPPCAAFSMAGRVIAGGDWRDDHERIGCIQTHFSLLEQLRPTFWAWESVPRAFTAGRELVDDLTKRALRRGYSVTYLLHNAKWLGLSQERPRFFFVAHKRQFEPALPTWEAAESCGEVLRKMNDIGEMDCWLPERHAILLPQLGSDGNLRDVWEKNNPPSKRKLNANGHIAGRPSFGYRRLRQHSISRTVAGYEQVHPTEDRCITSKETAKLCGFPSDYEFVATSGKAKLSLIARGVCPPVGEWLARSVKASLAAPVTRGEIRLIDLRKPPGTSQWLKTMEGKRHEAVEEYEKAKAVA